MYTYMFIIFVHVECVARTRIRVRAPYARLRRHDNSKWFIILFFVFLLAHRSLFAYDTALLQRYQRLYICLSNCMS